MTKIKTKLFDEYNLCESKGGRCFNKATEHHHKFSDTDANVKLYGRKLIDDDRNVQFLCCDCHHNKSLKKFTEQEFCRIFGIEPRSKAAQNKKVGRNA